MPVTVSHPVLSVGFKKFGLVLSALVVGSMMPDFEFFLRLSSGRVIGHTFEGIFLFCIPLGLVVLFLFHKLMKFPLLSLVPHNHQLRLYPLARRFSFFPLKNFLNIVFSLFVGSFTHLIADAFTHHDGFFVERISLLSEPVVVLPHGTIRVYFLLQYLISTVGALFLVYWYLKWYYRADPEKQVIPHRFHISRKVGIVLSIVIFALSMGITYGVMLAKGNGKIELAKSMISLSAIASASGLMIGLIGFGIMWHFFIPHHKRVEVLESEEA
jgi:hypothetical protein